MKFIPIVLVISIMHVHCMARRKSSQNPADLPDHSPASSDVTVQEPKDTTSFAPLSFKVGPYGVGEHQLLSINITSDKTGDFYYYRVCPDPDPGDHSCADGIIPWGVRIVPDLNEGNYLVTVSICYKRKDVPEGSQCGGEKSQPFSQPGNSKSRIGREVQEMKEISDKIKSKAPVIREIVNEYTKKLRRPLTAKLANLPCSILSCLSLSQKK